MKQGYAKLLLVGILLLFVPVGARYRGIRGNNSFEKLMTLIRASESPQLVKTLLKRAKLTKKQWPIASQESQQTLVLRQQQKASDEIQQARILPDRARLVNSLSSTGIHNLAVIAIFHPFIWISLALARMYMFVVRSLSTLGIFARSTLNSQKTNTKSVLHNQHAQRLLNAQKIADLIKAYRV